MSQFDSEYPREMTKEQNNYLGATMMRIEQSDFNMPDVCNLSFSVIPSRSPVFKGHPNLGEGVKALRSASRGYTKVNGWLYQIVDNSWVLRYAIVGTEVEKQ